MMTREKKGNSMKKMKKRRKNPNLGRIRNKLLYKILIHLI
jgi:hypothetical protein